VAAEYEYLYVIIVNTHIREIMLMKFRPRDYRMIRASSAHATAYMISQNDQRLMELLREFENEYSLMPIMESDRPDAVEKYCARRCTTADDIDFVRRYVMLALDIYGELQNDRCNWCETIECGDLTPYIARPCGPSIELGRAFLCEYAPLIVLGDEIFYYVSIAEWVFYPQFATECEILHINVIKSIYNDYLYGRLDHDVFTKLLSAPVRIDDTNMRDIGAKLIEINDNLPLELRLPELLTHIESRGVTYGYRLLYISAQARRENARHMLKWDKDKNKSRRYIRHFRTVAAIEKYIRPMILASDRRYFVEFAKSYITNGAKYMLIDVAIIKKLGVLLVLCKLKQKSCTTEYAHRNLILSIRCALEITAVTCTATNRIIINAANKFYSLRYIAELLPDAFDLRNEITIKIPRFTIIRPNTSRATYAQICHTYLAAELT
jgi:hypothetical protein